MAIPVLGELSGELERLYAAGSPLARADVRLQKYIPALQKLGGRANVFSTLADRLEKLMSEDASLSPENLLESGVLLHALLGTQGVNDTRGELREFPYSPNPLAVSSAACSTLREVIPLLESQSQASSDPLVWMHHRGEHRDPRLYRLYVSAVGDRRTPVSSHVAERILPELGQDIVPCILEQLDFSGTGRHARLFRALYAILGKDILPYSRKAIENGKSDLVAEAVATLCEDAGSEAELLQYTKDRREAVRTAADVALIALGLQKRDEELSNPSNTSAAVSAAPQVGSIMKFGNYDWQVLAVEDDRILLISKNVTHVDMKYHVKYEWNICWETCALRKWMNRELLRTFSEEEQARICLTTNVNELNPWYDRKPEDQLFGVNDTVDKIFLLSVSEVIRYFGDSGDLKKRRRKNEWGDPERGGGFFFDRYNGRRIACYRNFPAWWWLRSPGERYSMPSFINFDGSIGLEGRDVYGGADGNGGVRPALWLSLEP